MRLADKLIGYFYSLLFFTVPLILFPKTSELFEFNKMILTYIFTILIVSGWLVRMVIEKKVNFRRTLLDIPLIIFLTSQTLSTLISIDSRTSLLGYYSRFHGGLLSSYSYALLYWAFVSNMDRQKTLNAIKSLLASATVVSLYAILQHFGIDAHIWVQDVKNRVFSTLGQPNWLAAWLVAIIPVIWAMAVSNFKIQVSSFKSLYKLIWILLSILFFLTLLYTRSRSGLLAFGISSIIFWSLSWFTLLKNKTEKGNLIRTFLICNLSFVILVLVSGTPWTTKLKDILYKSATINIQPVVIQGPALETGGSESGTIRRIVWRGAIDIWKHYPILGTGVETFALSYYQFRQVEHNLVSEWDYLYNKAHNEYLNFAATTGTFGLLSYIILIGAIIFQIAKELRKNVTPTSYFLLPTSFLAGFVSILITNFFGFSVVPVALLFFLFPALAVGLTTGYNQEGNKIEHSTGLNSTQKTGIIVILLVTGYCLLVTARYWYADYLYSYGKGNNDAGNFVDARNYLKRAVKLSPSESIFWDELSTSTSKIAYYLAEQGDQDTAQKLAASAVAESKLASDLSPSNVNILRNKASIFIELSAINPNYIVGAKDALTSATELAPTEAKLFLNLGLSYLRMGDYEKAISIIQKTIEMKPNYYNAHYALALMYIDTKDIEKAKNELRYILDKISPDDEQAKRELEELK
ncbi:MAG: hypothetical protein UT08_C0010G0036 [Candidatus Woesebacteria bacterium GW2011_GWB1_38_8]|uniref:O-antigen ligase-related domain-containing protein n=1 Tax=Candidatus Woesebacteria bacterium GW2011_GWB1_38_8 TaxID=1618570 RepID=A0A0G0NGW6_9BACT|nr:MAG: hypothetical protein UT08_C0010G0036 [Candidatus Woesebacteria bacterium GW2011_GWB1_38_8]